MNRNIVKYWLVYDDSCQDIDDMIGWSKDPYMVKTYANGRKEMNCQTVVIKEFDNKHSIIEFMFSKFPDLIQEFSEYGKREKLNVFKDLELIKCPSNGKFFIITVAYMDKFRRFLGEADSYSSNKFYIQRYSKFIKDKISPMIKNENVLSSLDNLVDRLDAYMMLLELREEFFEYCNYDNDDGSVDYADFSVVRETFKRQTGLDIVIDDDDDYYFGIFDEYELFVFEHAIVWMGDDI